MPNPKRRISKARKDRRRSMNALEAHALVKCSNCGTRILPHTVCTSCGYYRGRQVVHVER